MNLNSGFTGPEAIFYLSQRLGEANDGGSALCHPGASEFRAVRAGGRRLRAPLRKASMIIDFVIGGVVAVLLLGYLAYALLRPEKF
jgi:K+-transporting ATPase KdpF subunit